MADASRPLPPPRVPRPVTAPPHRGRVLVVAPHPDDEAIGPGATLVLHRKLGDDVDALFVTSGVHGDNRGRLPEAEYIALRRREAQAAAGVLGIGRTEFWDYPDGMVVTEGDLEAVTLRLGRLLLSWLPTVIYAPHSGEQHSDHFFVSHAARRAVADVQERGHRCHLIGYEVWTPMQPDWAVDVAAVYATKLAAIRCYRSQLELNDIPRAVEGLNTYRAVLLPPGGSYAEVFAEVA